MMKFFFILLELSMSVFGCFRHVSGGNIARIFFVPAMESGLFLSMNCDGIYY